MYDILTHLCCAAFFGFPLRISRAMINVVATISITATTVTPPMIAPVSTDPLELNTACVQNNSNNYRSAREELEDMHGIA